MRQETLPVDPQNPNVPPQTIELKPESDWTVERIRYKFPLEIILENFFNADLDVYMEIRFMIQHEETGTTLDVDVTFDVDANFETGEHVLSFLTPFSGAATLAISKTLNNVLPMVLDCRKTNIEANIGNHLIDDRVTTALNGLSDGRIYDVRIVPGSGFNNNIFVIVCAISEESEEDNSGPVVEPVVVRI